DEVSPFISIDEFIQHETLEPSYLSIPDYVEATINQEPIAEEMITPLELPGASYQDSKAALAQAEALRKPTDRFAGALVSDLDDITGWSHLGLCLSCRLRAGMGRAMFRRTGDA